MFEIKKYLKISKNNRSSAFIKKSKIGIILVLLLFIESCGYEKPVKIKYKELPFKALPQKVKDYMYFKKGSWWIYKVTEPHSQRYDTIDLLYSFIDTLRVRDEYWHYDYEALSVGYRNRNKVKDGSVIGRPQYSYVMLANGGITKADPNFKIRFECYRNNPYSYQQTTFFYPFDNSIVGGESDILFKGITKFTNYFGHQFDSVAVFNIKIEEMVSIEAYGNSNTLRYWAPNVGLVRWISKDSVVSHELFSYKIIQ